jgi:hypothetical protein
MKNMRRALALTALASMTACGGGSGTQAPLPGATASAPARTPDAKGTVTLRFPAHVAKAKLGSQTASTKSRNPAYINPTGTNTLVVTEFNNTITDPSTGNSYFALSEGVTNADGSTSLTIPLLSGTYNQGQIAISEYDGGGNPLAYGYNAQYTDINGNVQSGAFTLSPGGTAAPVITLVMNAEQIAFTTDPVSGSDAVILSQNSGAPTHFGGAGHCWSAGANTFYVFPADLSATFVLPGTASGFTGGDQSSSFPGVPSVSLTSQFTDNGGGRQVLLVPTIPGGNSYQVSDPSNFFSNLEATFLVQNPLVQIGAPFGYNSSVSGYVDLGDASC